MCTYSLRTEKQSTTLQDTGERESLRRGEESEKAFVKMVRGAGAGAGADVRVGGGNGDGKTKLEKVYR